MLRVISRHPGWITLVLVGLALTAILIGIRACVRASCSERILSSSPSPDGSYDAQLIEGVCATGPYGSTYHVLAIRKTGSSNRGTEFFTTDASSPHGDLSNADR